jgi:hypothetical protein
MLFPAEPSVTYRDSFIQSVHEFQAEGRQQYFDLNSLTNDFGSFVHVKDPKGYGAGTSGSKRSCIP